MKKILVVDDDKDLLYILAENLSEEGYAVITANKAETALKLSREESPDLVILDVMLPGKDGTSVAREMQESPATKDIPVIFLTGLLSKEEEKRSGGHVAGKIFMAKPYEMKDLLAEIKKHI
jgi:DNA-binding response OmpR family regulator